MAAKNMADVVVGILERELKDAQDRLKSARQNNAPDLKSYEQAVEDAKKALNKFNNAEGSDRRRLTDRYLNDYYDQVGDWVRDLVKQFPQLTALFSKAIKNGWSDQEFISEIYKSSWWKEQKKLGRGNRWLEAFILENDPAQQGRWLDSIESVKQKIKDLADSLYNMPLDEANLDKIARRYLYQGWDLNDERGLRVWLAGQLQRELGAEPVDGEEGFTPGGMLADYERSFRDAVRGFGVQRTEDWYRNTAAAILNPDSGITEDDIWNEIIAEAESLYPALAGKLSKDRSVRDAVNGYLAWAAQILEIDPESMELTDPALSKALGYSGADGNPTLMPLWEYRKELRKDPRWQQTDNARSSYSDLASTFLRSMGAIG